MPTATLVCGDFNEELAASAYEGPGKKIWRILTNLGEFGGNLTEIWARIPHAAARRGGG